MSAPLGGCARSHSRHHAYHQHHTKDLSHPWYDPEEWAAQPKWKHLVMENPLSPFYLFPAYLYLGVPDGSHMFPGSMYKGESNTEKAKCVVSSLSVFLFQYILLTVTQ